MTVELSHLPYYEEILQSRVNVHGNKETKVEGSWYGLYGDMLEVFRILNRSSKL